MKKKVLVTDDGSGIGYYLTLSLLEDSEKVGRALSRNIESGRRIITADWKSALVIRIVKLFPYFIGKRFLKFNLNNQTIQSQ